MPHLRTVTLTELAFLLVPAVVACSSSRSSAGDAQASEAAYSSATWATTVVAKNSGLCVDIPGFSTTVGAAIDQWSCNGGANQSFVFTPSSGGSYTIKSESSGLCLQYGTSKGAAVVQTTCSGAPNQDWVPKAVSSGYANLVAASGNGCLNVSGSSDAKGAPLLTWTCDAEADELFKFTLPGGSPCAAVADLVATSTSGKSVSLSWTGAPGATFQIARKTYCADDGYVTLATLPAGSTSYTDTSVQENWVYWYELVASENGQTASAALATQAASSPVTGCAPGATAQSSGVTSCGAPPADGGGAPRADSGTPPPANDAGAPPQDAGPGAPIVPAFYVATTGSDANPGTAAEPFATLGKAQLAMQASTTLKTTYVRAGSYRLPSLACGGSSCGLDLGSADDGETWSYYPPDGVDSASLSGGSTANGNGLVTAISVSNTNHLTIDGLTIHDFQYAGIGAGGGTNNLVLENNVIFGGYTASGSSNPGGFSCYGCANTTIAHNVFHDMAQFGISVSNVNGNISNLLVTGNVFYDTCTAIADCGALYVQDITATATNMRFTNNYIHDGNTFAGLGSGYGSAIYADDCTSNIVEAGNVLTGRNGANTTMVHGGSNIHQTGNLTDLAGFAQHVATFQTSGVAGCKSATMSDNEYEKNVVIGAGGGGGYALLSGSPQHAPIIANNDYYSYAGAAISSGLGSYGDTDPAHENPELTGWVYAVAAGSPVLGAPVSFPALVGGWGPPGYVLPQTGTPPSSPH